MSPVRRHFWQVVARVNSSLHRAEEVVLELVHAGRREQHRGVPARHQHVARAALCPLVSKKARYFSRSSSVFMGEDSGVRGQESEVRATLAACGLANRRHDP